MRRKPARRRDDTWVVKEDEFHPLPHVAAANADIEAKKFSLRVAQDDLARVERKLAQCKGPQDADEFLRERGGLKATIARLRDELAPTAEEVMAREG